MVGQKDKTEARRLLGKAVLTACLASESLERILQWQLPNFVQLLVNHGELPEIPIPGGLTVIARKGELTSDVVFDVLRGEELIRVDVTIAAVIEAIATNVKHSC